MSPSNDEGGVGHKDMSGLSDMCMNVESSIDYFNNIDEILTANETCDCDNKRFMYVPECNCTVDYEDGEFGPKIAEVLPIGTVYVLIFLIGTIGNFLVILVVNRYKKMRTVTNIFLASLSTADMCLIWFNVPLMYFKYISFTWIFGEFMCYFVHYIQDFAMCCSVLTLTTISIERYMAIAHPMKTMWMSSIGRAKKVIACIWLLSAILALPTALRMQYTIGVSQGAGISVGRCFKEVPKRIWGINLGDWQAHMERGYVVYHTTILLVIPVCTMIVCYSQVAYIVYSSSSDDALTSVPLMNLSNRRSRRKHLQGLFEQMQTQSTAIVRLQHFTDPVQVATKTAPTDVMDQVEKAGKLLSRTARIYEDEQKISKDQHSAAKSSNASQATLEGKKKMKRKPTRVCDNSKKQIVKMLIAIVILFTLCWTPTMVNDMLVAFNWVCVTSVSTFSKYVRMTIAVAAYSQSCINPCVYAFMSHHFRSTFLSVFLNWWRRRQERSQFAATTTMRGHTLSNVSQLSTRTPLSRRGLGGQQTGATPKSYHACGSPSSVQIEHSPRTSISYLNRHPSSSIHRVSSHRSSGRGAGMTFSNRNLLAPLESSVVINSNPNLLAPPSETPGTPFLSRANSMNLQQLKEEMEATIVISTDV